MISVIIPTFKPGSYIFECLNSLKKQIINKNKFEIILILNGCNEPYYSKLNKFINHNLSELNILLIQTDLPGVSNARNLGLDKAYGDYICFIDDDDIISENYLNELLESQKDSYSITVSNVKTFNKSFKNGNDYISQAFKKYYNTRNFSLLKERSFLSSSCCKLIPKNVIGKRRFNTNISIGEDSLFMFEISDKIKGLHFTSPNAIYFRRLREGSASRKKRNILFFFKNKILLIYNYIKTYISNPFKYNFPLFISRIIAVILR